MQQLPEGIRIEAHELVVKFGSGAAKGNENSSAELLEFRAKGGGETDRRVQRAQQILCVRLAQELSEILRTESHEPVVWSEMAPPSH